VDKEMAVYAVVGVALIILGVLRGTNNLSEQNFMQGFMFCLGAILGGGVVYFRVKYLGSKKSP
jgi:drug/metabolite transporter (DMT)-like permease